MTDAPAERDTQKPIAVALVVGLVLCALAAHRQAQRDALALHDAPESRPPSLPRTLVIPRKPLPPVAHPPSDEGAPRADPQPAAPAAPTGLGRDALERLGVETFSEQRPAIVECLREERGSRPDAGGKLEIAVDVDARGLVAGVALGESPVRSATFDECVILSVAQLVFPAELAGRDVAITFDLR